MLSATWTIKVGVHDDTDPAVAMDYTDGDFVIAYQTSNYYIATPISYIYAAKVRSAAGTLRATYFVTGTSSPPLGKPSICINHLDDYFIGYALHGISGDEAFGVYGRRGRLY